MIRRFLMAFGAAAVIIVPSLSPGRVQAQAPAPKASDWKLAHTAGGQPDFQGIWTFKTITPLERPKELGDKAFLTAAEAAAFERQVNQRQNRDLIDPETGGAGIYAPASNGGVVPYNEFWYDRGDRIVGSRRTSLVIDPVDGRIPARTPEAEARLAKEAASSRDDQLGRPHADNPEDRTLHNRSSGL